MGDGVAIGLASDVKVLVDLAESLRHQVDRMHQNVCSQEPTMGEWDIVDFLADAERESMNLRITLGKALGAAREIDPEAKP